MKFIPLLFAITAPLIAAESVVTFNEIHYNPIGEAEDGEWIELHNQMAINVDLSGWRLSGGVNFTIPEGTTVPGGGYYLVAKNPANPALDGLNVNGPFEGQLSNSGETIRLRSRSERLMDEIDYSDGGEWPIGPDGSGATLSKIEGSLLSGKSASWQASRSIGGSPGSTNPPVSSAELKFNEIPAGGGAEFFVELVNSGSSPMSTDGFELKIEGNSPETVSLPNLTLAPGAFLVITEDDLAEIPADGDKLFLLSSNGTEFVDARPVTGRLRGLNSQIEGWLYPNLDTPNAANSFELNSDIVINEICYNPPILNSDPGIPPTIATRSLIDRGAEWRFNENGDALPSDWAAQAHPVGGSWKTGTATLAYDNGLGITNLSNPASAIPRVVTYYFERDFSLSAEEVGQLGGMILNHRIDDGAIFYFNGIELDRFQMPEGEVTSSTFASDSVGDAEWVEDYQVSIPPGIAVAGLNRISVEVHQRSLGSSDVGFDFEAKAEFITEPGVPSKPARPAEDQWIELHNRSGEDVDLTGWDFGEGIVFDFPLGTTIPAGGFLVVANNPGQLGADHPGINIVGPFEGNLSRRGETLTLRDDKKNPADSLRYFDGGQWPDKADAGGSSMELIDPDADNSLPGAWAASDELARTEWQDYSFRATASASAVGPDNQWREFIFGMLEDGEILIDDLTVVENPDGAATAMIENGDFENGNLNTWRALGNHSDVEIISDPDGGGNVLHLNAIGSTEHMHNHIETTLVSGRRVTNGREYEVSFRARWLGGNHLLHTRLYFNRIPHTFVLDRPEKLGTPGAANSTLVTNAGPTSRGLAHSPVVPAVGEAVTVSVEASDPDGVQGVTLNYRVEGGAFSSVTMSQNGTRWEGNIPGRSSGNVVQFYLTATDNLGATSFIPKNGPDSRAMYEVNDGRAATTDCINNFRIVMDPDDLTEMFRPRNLMSNGRIPCTVIDREGRAYYDVGVRIKGSERARAQRNRVGFNVGFSSDQLFRNVHRSVAIDRSEGQVVGQRELLFDLMATSSGGIPGEFNDLAYVISPNPIHTSAAILQMARFGSQFLDDQFENGSDGTVYEYELVYYPTSTDAGGYKIPQPDNVVGTNIRDLGDNPEDYRWTFNIKNNQEYDDFQPAMALAKQFSKSTADFNESVADVLDVDQWLRALAYSCATGAGDSFYTNSRHNGQFYGRPDGKVLYFPHDVDFAFSSSRGIFENSELNRIVRNQTYRRAYLAHLHEICTTVYNRTWMAPWTAHFDACVPGGNVFSDDLSYINSRSNYILGQINSQVREIDFAITSNGGNNFTSSEAPVTLTGTGWVNVHEIRLSSGTSLEHTWTSTDDWELSLALGQGEHPVTLQAYDSKGNLLGSDSITITQNGGIDTPSTDNLVITEIYYNPAGEDESTEFIELLNIGNVSLDLSGTNFSDGVDFVFPEGTTLAAGERIVVVRNQTAFIARYGAGAKIAGEFANGTGLSNGGESIVLRNDSGDVVQMLTYDDVGPWPAEADGDDFSLVLLDPAFVPGLPSSWRPSALLGGDPGAADSFSAFTGNANADMDRDGFPALIEHFLGTSDGDSTDTRDALQIGSLIVAEESFATLRVTYRVGADDIEARGYLSSDLQNWSMNPADIVLQNRVFNGDGTATLVWRSTTATPDALRQFFQLRAAQR